MWTTKDMAEGYNKAFPKYPPLTYTDKWVYGVWMIGNNYRSMTGYYGSYPPRYLDRVLSMFPDYLATRILHLFSGSLDEKTKGIRADIKDKIVLKNGRVIVPSIVVDAEKLTDSFLSDSFELIIADPPYSEEDAKRYGTCLVNRNKALKECYQLLVPGGFLCWLDQVKPMYRKAELSLIGTIGVDRSTNHRVRMLYIWQKGEE
jgi:hypothetical protein